MELLNTIVELFVELFVDKVYIKFYIIPYKEFLYQDSSSRGISSNFIKGYKGPTGGVSIITLIFFGT